MKEFYSQVKCDYNNGEGFWCVDAWRTDNGDEQGKVVAAIHEKTGDVFYCEPEARLSPLVAEAINRKQNEIKSSRKKVSPIEVTCYNQTSTYKSAKEAIAFFEECQMSTEGSERDRYTNILIKLRQGKTKIDDSRP